MACPSMPNFFMFMGPNATVGHGSLVYSLDWTAEWIVQWLRKMAREDIASIAPKQDVVDELVRYGDEIMKTLTWSGNCKYCCSLFLGRPLIISARRSVLVQEQPHRRARDGHVRRQRHAVPRHGRAHPRRGLRYPLPLAQPLSIHG